MADIVLSSEVNEEEAFLYSSSEKDLSEEFPRVDTVMQERQQRMDQMRREAQVQRITPSVCMPVVYDICTNLGVVTSPLVLCTDSFLYFCESPRDFGALHTYSCMVLYAWTYTMHRMEQLVSIRCLFRYFRAFFLVCGGAHTYHHEASCIHTYMRVYIISYVNIREFKPKILNCFMRVCM